jgi:hypothetical protein
MKSTYQIIIGVLLIIITVLILDEYCVITLIDCKCDCEAPGQDASGYVPGGGKAIAKSDADHYINYFSELLNDSTCQIKFTDKGWYISQVAISKMLARRADGTQPNGISCYFGADVNGQLSLLFDATVSDKQKLGGAPGELIFLAESMCPDDCGLIIDPPATQPVTGASGGEPQNQ